MEDVMRIYERPQTDEVLTVVRDCGPVSIHDIAEILGRTLKSVIQCVEVLRKERTIYIASYTRVINRGKWSPQYQLGDREDKAKPKAKTRKQIGAEYRARYRAKLNVQDMVARGTTYNFWKGLM